MTNTPPPPPPGGQQGQQQYGTSWQDSPAGQGWGPGQQQAWGPGHPPAPPVPPQQEKRSWFRRHKILTALLAVLALIVVVNLVGGGEDETPAASEPAGAAAPATDASTDAVEDEDDEAAGEEASAQDEPSAEEAAEEEPAEEAAPEAPGLNDPVRDGKFEFVVTEVETGLATIGESFTEEEAQGQFVVIHLKVTNVGDQAQTVFDSAQLLIDDQGREHQTSSAAIWLDEGLWLDDINPGNSMEGVLVYDIPKDAVPATLELHDSMFSGGVTVSLE
ncbi:MAG TPA: DUF4352 domain-containing protein [Ornithinicoccus sp.]|nr:DUF4352 domain-containing protein [Ornithinicoccus sp.]